MKKVPNRGRRPEGRTDRAVQDEKLLDALKSFISTGEGTSDEFQFERSQEQIALKVLNKVEYFSIYYIRNSTCQALNP